MDPESTYRTALRSLVARFRWGLLTESAWIAAARQINPEPEDVKAARRACLTVYSRTLHEACQDRKRHNQAYGELFDYLYPQAYARDANLAFEAAQDAIVLVYRSFAEPKLKKCQQPDAFLFFAQGKLRDAFSRIWRGPHGRTREPWPDSTGDDDDGAPYPKLRAGERTPLDDVLQGESARWLAVAMMRVASIILECLVLLWETVGWRRQLAAVIITFMDRLDDATIAQALKVDRSNVQTLRLRGLACLRTCLLPRLPVELRGEL